MLIDGVGWVVVGETCKWRELVGDQRRDGEDRRHEGVRAVRIRQRQGKSPLPSFPPFLSIPIANHLLTPSPLYSTGPDTQNGYRGELFQLSDHSIWYAFNTVCLFVCEGRAHAPTRRRRRAGYPQGKAAAARSGTGAASGGVSGGLRVRLVGMREREREGGGGEIVLMMNENLIQ